MRCWQSETRPDESGYYSGVRKGDDLHFVAAGGAAARVGGLDGGRAAHHVRHVGQVDGGLAHVRAGERPVERERELLIVPHVVDRLDHGNSSGTRKSSGPEFLRIQLRCT